MFTANCFSTAALLKAVVCERLVTSVKFVCRVTVEVAAWQRVGILDSTAASKVSRHTCLCSVSVCSRLWHCASQNSCSLFTKECTHRCHHQVLPSDGSKRHVPAQLITKRVFRRTIQEDIQRFSQEVVSSRGRRRGGRGL